MKKIFISSLLFAGVLLLGSCEKEKIGGTATEAVAGQWYITIDAVDANGNAIAEDGYADYYSTGRQMIFTYNTAANSSSEMYVDMTGLKTDFPFLNFKVVVPCDPSSRTFGSMQELENMIIYDLSYATADTTFVPEDTIDVERVDISCLLDTSIVAYDSIYIKMDTLYLIQDTTFVTLDTTFISPDTTYQITKIDTIISPLVIDTIMYDSIGVFFAHQEIVPADTIIEATCPIVDKIKIWNGKIAENAYTTPSGMPADKFEFEFVTDGDDAGYYINYDAENYGDFRVGYSFREMDGFDHYKVSGYRYTGFADDDE